MTRNASSVLLVTCLLLGSLLLTLVLAACQQPESKPPVQIINAWRDRRILKTPAQVNHGQGQQRVSKTPAQILDESVGSVAIIVAADDTSMKLGSGFFLGSPGLLLTNFHVVKNMEWVGVKLPTSQVLWAKTVRGFDLNNDLVLLQVERMPSSATTLRLGDSDAVRVGEPVVVVSNPEGLPQTVSNGLISGIRDTEGRELFQISAPVSHGSSGGPVFDERGDVIGVVVSSVESGQNLNFAIPINYAKSLFRSTTLIPIASLPKRGIGENEKPSSEGVTSEPEIPSTLPRFWKDTFEGQVAEIRINGDYLYQESSNRWYGNGGGEWEQHCEMKRDGSEWSGMCRNKYTWHTYPLRLGPWPVDLICSIDSAERISSVTPNRIEGKYEPIDFTPIKQTPPLCPTSAWRKAGWVDFALIPN